MLDGFTIDLGTEKVKLKSGFVAGWMADRKDTPMGMYSGKLSIAETNIALVHLLRAVIKMNTEEQFMNLAQSEMFVKIALEQAIKIEKENKDEDNLSLEQHKEIVLKMRRDN